MVTIPLGSGNEPLLTVGAALEAVHGALNDADLAYGHGTDSAWDEAVQLVLCACELPMDSGDEVRLRPLQAEERSRIDRWCEARVSLRTPLPYLTGRAWFAGLEFICDPRALVPRSPLGELIDTAYAPWWSGPAPRRLLDLCCGGGAIGIAAAVYEPEASVTLADLDTRALSLAHENLAFHGLEGRVHTRQSDLFAALGGERFDVILSNPPYVNEEDLQGMPDEYRAEPALGLGSGKDGLDHARRILTGAADHLNPGGLLFLELGNSWVALDALLSQLPLTWVEFANGGHGVLVATAEELPAISQALGEGPKEPGPVR